MDVNFFKFDLILLWTKGWPSWTRQLLRTLVPLSWIWHTVLLNHETGVCTVLIIGWFLFPMEKRSKTIIMSYEWWWCNSFPEKCVGVRLWVFFFWWINWFEVTKNGVCFFFFSICTLVRTLERLLCSYSSSPHDAGVSCGVPDLLNMYSNSAYSAFSL